MSRRNSVASGQRLSIPHDEYNALLALLRADLGMGSQHHGEPFDNTKVWIRNDSGFDRARFELLGIDDDLAIDPTDTSQAGANFDQMVLTGVLPDSRLHYGRFVICQEPIRNGQIGRAVVSGVTWAKLKTIEGYVDVETLPNTADINVGGTTNADLKQLYVGGTYSRGSARILWKPKRGAETTYALVRLGDSQTGIAIASTANSTISTASLTQYNLTSLGQGEGKSGWSLAAGILTCTHRGTYSTTFNGICTVQYVQNDYTTWNFSLQSRDSSGSGWGDTFFTLAHRQNTSWPNVATIGGTDSEDIRTFSLHHPQVEYLPGNQLRIASEAIYDTTLSNAGLYATVTLVRF